MGDQLVRLLGRRVKTDGVVDRIGFRERGLDVGAVHGTGRRVNQVPHAGLAATLHDVPEPDQVGVDVGGGVVDGVPDARLGGEVDDSVESAFFEQPPNRVSICKVAAHHLKTWNPLKFGGASFLQRDRVVVVEVVEPDDLDAVLKETPRRVAANESGRAGDQDLVHATALP